MRLSKSLFCVAAHVAFRENLVKSVETNLKLAQNYIKVLMFMTKTKPKKKKKKLKIEKENDNFLSACGTNSSNNNKD